MLKANPYNICHGYASGQLSVKHEGPKIHIGSLAMVAEGPIIEIDGVSLLALSIGKAGDLRVSVDLYDESDRRLARIKDNIWEAEDPFPWDLEFGYRHLVVRRARGSIALELDLRGEEPQLKGQLWYGGHSIDLGNRGIRFEAGGGISEMTLDGFAVKLDTATGTVELGAPRSEPRTVSDRHIGRNDPCWCGSGRKFKRCHGA